jgi:hypothetical protein
LIDAGPLTRSTAFSSSRSIIDILSQTEKMAGVF